MANSLRAGETPANVAARATQTGVLNRVQTNLLGVFGPENDLNALVRLPDGRIRRVKPGSRLSMGRVVGVDAKGLMVQTNGRTQRITIPR